MIQEHPPPNNGRWKRRILRTTLLSVVLIGGLSALIFARFHFSNQDFPTLANWQGNDESQSGSTDSRPQIIGHRGSGLPAKKDGSPLFIGNTAAAIQGGINAGVDWIEIDLRKSADNHLVVFHDECIDLRTTGEGKIHKLSLAAIQEVEVLVDPPEGILTLDEMFDRFHLEKRKWIFDIKAIGIHKEVIAWIKEKIAEGTLSKDQFILFGMHDVLIDYTESGYNLGYTATWGEELLGNKLEVLFTPSRIIARCEKLGSRLLVIPTIFASQSLVETAQSKGLDVWIYGSDNELDHKHFAGRGIKGLIVDNPKDAMKCFEGQVPKT